MDTEMVTKFEPYDIGIWLQNIDINSLSDAECDAIAHVDIEDDTQLTWLVRGWISPRYQLWNAFNQSRMRGILEASVQWSEKDLRKIFNMHQLPSGQEIKDIGRFLKALRDEFL
jgi:hypothetical protein